MARDSFFRSAINWPSLALITADSPVRSPIKILAWEKPGLPMGLKKGDGFLDRLAGFQHTLRWVAFDPLQFRVQFQLQASSSVRTQLNSAASGARARSRVSERGCPGGAESSVFLTHDP